jgi:hypothetical protein
MHHCVQYISLFKKPLFIYRIGVILPILDLEHNIILKEDRSKIYSCGEIRYEWLMNLSFGRLYPFLSYRYPLLPYPPRRGGRRRGGRGSFAFPFFEGDSNRSGGLLCLPLPLSPLPLPPLPLPPLPLPPLPLPPSGEWGKGEWGKGEERGMGRGYIIEASKCGLEQRKYTMETIARMPYKRQIPYSTILLLAEQQYVLNSKKTMTPKTSNSTFNYFGQNLTTIPRTRNKNRELNFFVDNKCEFLMFKNRLYKPPNLIAINNILKQYLKINNTKPFTIILFNLNQILLWSSKVLLKTKALIMNDLISRLLNRLPNKFHSLKEWAKSLDSSFSDKSLPLINNYNYVKFNYFYPLQQMFWRWLKKRHLNRPISWVLNQYYLIFYTTQYHLLPLLKFSYLTKISKKSPRFVPLKVEMKMIRPTDNLSIEPLKTIHFSSIKNRHFGFFYYDLYLKKSNLSSLLKFYSTNFLLPFPFPHPHPFKEGVKEEVKEGDRGCFFPIPFPLPFGDGEGEGGELSSFIKFAQTNNSNDLFYFSKTKILRVYLISNKIFYFLLKNYKEFASLPHLQTLSLSLYKNPTLSNIIMVQDPSNLQYFELEQKKNLRKLLFKRSLTGQNLSPSPSSSSPLSPKKNLGPYITTKQIPIGKKLDLTMFEYSMKTFLGTTNLTSISTQKNFEGNVNYKWNKLFCESYNTKRTASKLANLKKSNREFRNDFTYYTFFSKF